MLRRFCARPLSPSPVVDTYRTVRSSLQVTAMAHELKPEKLAQLRADFESRPRNVIAQNAVSKAGISDACLSRSTLQATNTAFSCRLPNSKPITDQKSSGRCWIFATLNSMRIPMIKAYELERFEFSETYLYFWDKVERANFFLETVIDLIQKGEDDIEGRVLSHLLTIPADDGGQWDMVTSLIIKHGVVPISCMPEAKSSIATRPFFRLLRRKLRQNTFQLRTLYAESKSIDKLREAKEEMVSAIYRICCISLGSPPEKITWEYTNKSNIFHRHADLTPQMFYEKFVMPHFDVTSKVCLVHDPRPGNPYYENYTVEHLGCVVGGRPVKYINVELEDLRNSIRRALVNNEGVWFGSDVVKCFDNTTGFMDLELYSHEQTFDTDLSLGKSDSLLYGETIPEHAMLFTGFNAKQQEGQTVEEANKSGEITKWCVENSWGNTYHDKGYLTMSNNWFGEFVFMAVVDLAHISPEAAGALDKPVRVLPPWDPLGTLA